MHTPAATLSVTSPCPSPSSAAQIARKTAGSRSPPVSGISAKKPRGSVTTRCQVAAKVRAPAARASGSGKAMGRPYSGGTPGGPGRARRRADALACWRAAVAAVEPGRLVAAVLGREGEALVLRDAAGRMRARHAGPALLVGAGKAALAMARAADAAARGLVRGGVLAVLSGGASALLEVPAPGVALDDLRALTAALLAAGADIAALNTVRRHCSLVKGGGLARAARGAAGLWALVLSDVVGDDPAVIASGPTVADPTTFAEALAVLERLPARSVPAAIRAHLERGAAGRAAETVKPGDPVLARTATVIVGGNRHAVEAAAAEARARGYATSVLARPFTGDAAEAGRHLAATILALPPSGGAALVGGGETTVRVVAGGRGGRCQHLALAAAVVLAGSDAVLLAAGTDGVDGPTDAAGACVDGV